MSNNDLFIVVLFGILGVLVLMSSMGYIKKAITIYRNNKLFKEKMKEVEAMKDKGELHDWVNIPQGDGGSMYVCKKTGFAPSMNGFVPIEMVEQFLKLREHYKKVEKEFEEFKEKRLTELSLKYKIGYNDLEELADEIFSIKKDFAIQKLDEVEKELKVKIEVK